MWKVGRLRLIDEAELTYAITVEGSAKRTRMIQLAVLEQLQGENKPPNIPLLLIGSMAFEIPQNLPSDTTFTSDS